MIDWFLLLLSIIPKRTWKKSKMFCFEWWFRLFFFGGFLLGVVGANRDTWYMIGFPPVFIHSYFCLFNHFLFVFVRFKIFLKKKPSKKTASKTCQVILFIREVWKNDENHKGCWFRVGLASWRKEICIQRKKTRRFECQEGFEGCLMMSEVLFLWLDDDDDDEDDDDVFHPSVESLSISHHHSVIEAWQNREIKQVGRFFSPDVIRSGGLLITFSLSMYIWVFPK